jgi:hypothetical protein
VTPVSALVAVIFAAETSPPDWSVTVPERLADTWAKAADTIRSSRSVTRTIALDKVQYIAGETIVTHLTFETGIQSDV